MNARSQASMALLTAVLLVLAVGWTGATAAPAGAAGAAGAFPGRQGQLMAAECQLERAPMRCERSSTQWHCSCGAATLAAHTEVLSLVLPGEETTWQPRQRHGLAAK